MDWVTVGSPGNAADAVLPNDPERGPVNCGDAQLSACGAVAYMYQIGKNEVTNTQYAEFLNAKATADPLALNLYSASMNSNANGGITQSGSSGSYSYSVKAGFANKPVNYVSFWDAARFANWLNNGQGSADTETGAYTITAVGIGANSITRNAGPSIFLPSEDERTAAYYDGGSMSYFDYPADRTFLPRAQPGPMANTANCTLAVGDLTDVGSYTGSASPYGTFDQDGNVLEWNEQVRYTTLRGVRGGDWQNPNLIGLAAGNFGSGDPLGGDVDYLRLSRRKRCGHPRAQYRLAPDDGPTRDCVPAETSPQHTTPSKYDVTLAPALSTQ